LKLSLNLVSQITTSDIYHYFPCRQGSLVLFETTSGRDQIKADGIKHAITGKNEFDG